MISARVDKLELPFNAFGVDPYGISRPHLTTAFSVLSLLYHLYFRVRCVGAENIPARGRAMLVGNHSGGFAIDGAMVIASCFFELNPPRLAQGMADKFINKLPIASLWSNRTGQFTGLPEHAERLLADERLLMVFPEGNRGTAKLYSERYSMVDFGTGFMRLALKMKTPIVPFGFLGGGSAVPSVVNLYTLGKWVGVPYIPVTPYGLPIPLPVRLQVRYGEPMVFQGDGNEDDAVVGGYVEQVKARITGLIQAGSEERRDAQGVA
ncbi:MAG: lysophospholipid acyltransferase family protein [Myxococcaceae bacterium]